MSNNENFPIPEKIDRRAEIENTRTEMKDYLRKLQEEFPYVLGMLLHGSRFDKNKIPRTDSDIDAVLILAEGYLTDSNLPEGRIIVEDLVDFCTEHKTSSGFEVSLNDFYTVSEFFTELSNFEAPKHLKGKTIWGNNPDAINYIGHDLNNHPEKEVGEILNESLSSEKMEGLKQKADLHNEDYLIKVFESGTTEELEEVASYHKINPEQLKLFCHFAKLRREILNVMMLQLEDRRNNKPVATELELNMGAYLENIEPQVRETVINLRKKGYKTYESGFGGYKGQLISFEDNCLADFKIDDLVIKKFKNQGVDLKITAKSIELDFNQEFSEVEIENFWQEIESYFPDLGKMASPCELSQAELFRRQQEKVNLDNKI